MAARKEKSPTDTAALLPVSPVPMKMQLPISPATLAETSPQPPPPEGEQEPLGVPHPTAVLAPLGVPHPTAVLPPAPLPETIFAWDVPCERFGYTLRIEAPAPNVHAAREMAMAYRVPDDSQSVAGAPHQVDPLRSTEEIAKGRPLTQLEANWVGTTPPVVVRRTADVTLSHEAALLHNTRLNAENVGYLSTKDLFAEHEIDVFHPQVFIDRVMAEASAVVKAATDKREAEERALWLVLTRLEREFAAAIGSSRYAPPKAAALVEPDYADLTIVVHGDIEESRNKFRRLASANWTVVEPGEPLTEDEQTAMEMLTADETGFFDTSIRGFITEDQERGLRALRARFAALFGKRHV